MSVISIHPDISLGTSKRPTAMSRILRCSFYLGVLHIVTVMITCISPARVVSTRFEKLPGRHFTCDVTSTSLSTSTANAVDCALACTALEDCKNFALTTGYQSSCGYCPAKNITGLTSESTGENDQTETWVIRTGQITDPPVEENLLAPEAGALGSLTVVKGTMPVPYAE